MPGLAGAASAPQAALVDDSDCPRASVRLSSAATRARRATLAALGRALHLRFATCRTLAVQVEAHAPPSPRRPRRPGRFGNPHPRALGVDTCWTRPCEGTCVADVGASTSFVLMWPRSPRATGRGAGPAVSPLVTIGLNRVIYRHRSASDASADSRPNASPRQPRKRILTRDRAREEVVEPPSGWSCRATSTHQRPLE